MDDVTFDVSSSMKKPVAMDVITYNTGHTKGTVLASYDLPFDCLKSAFQEIAFKHFVYFRGHIRMSFKLNATPMVAGKIGVAFVPQMNLDGINNYYPSTYHGGWVPQLNSVYLDPSKGLASGELVVPFTSTCNFLELVPEVAFEQDGQVWGTIVVVVMNELRTGTSGITSVQIRPYVSFEGQVFVPRGGTFAQGNSISSTTNVYAGKNSQVKYTGDDFDQKTGAIKPNVSPEIGIPPGMHAPSINKPPVTIQRDLHPNLNNTISPISLERMTQDPESIQPADFEHFGVDCDEMSFKCLLTKPFRNTFRQWTNAQAEGTLLYQTYVWPHMVVNGSAVDTTTAEKAVMMTPMDAVSRHFTAWKGGFKIRVEAVGTVFHTGILNITFSYGQFNSVEPLTTYGAVLNIQQNKSVVLDIPYHSNRPWLFTYGGQDGFGSGADHLRHFSLGLLEIHVGNKLVAPDTVANLIEVNIYVAAGEDFALYYPRVHQYSVNGPYSRHAPTGLGYQVESVVGLLSNNKGEIYLDERALVSKDDQNVPTTEGTIVNNKFVHTVGINKGMVEDASPFSIGRDVTTISVSDCNVLDPALCDDKPSAITKAQSKDVTLPGAVVATREEDEQPQTSLAEATNQATMGKEHFYPGISHYGEACVSVRDYLRQFKNVATLSVTTGNLKWSPFELSDATRISPWHTMSLGYSLMRGSMRFLFVVHDHDGTSPLDHFPIVHIGVDNNFNGDNNFSIPSFVIGGAVPTKMVEIPFICPAANSRTPYGHRIGLRSAFMAYRFHLTSVQNVRVGVYMASGTDFRFGAFRGFPDMKLFAPNSPIPGTP